MPRRRRNLPLWLRLLVRRLRSPEGKLAPLAVLSIAVSVTLATGLEMASRSAQRQLEMSAEAIVGSAKVEVVAGAVGLPEAILEEIRMVSGVRAASPLVSTKVRLVDDDFAINIVGVDLAAEEQVRPASVERAGLKIRDPLRLLAVPNAVVVTKELLDRLGLFERWGRGERVEIRVRSSTSKLETLSVQGVLDPGGIATAFGGQLVLMDVYSAQLLAGRVGLFDRIDVVPAQGQAIDDLVERLSVDVAGVASVRHASGRRQWAEEFLIVVRNAALLFSGAGVLVACLLVYATTTQWVDRQRRQLATLRAVGMEANRVQRMVFVEVAAISLLGTTLGVAGGIAFSPLILSSVSGFLRMTGVDEIIRTSVQPSTLFVALAVGVVAGTTGSISPAKRAGHRFTIDSLDQALASSSDRALWIPIGVGSLLIFSLTVVFGSSIAENSSMIRLAIMIVVGPAAILAFAPTVLQAMQRLVRPLKQSSPPLGHLGLRFFAARPRSFGVALTAVSTLVGTLLAMFLLIATVGQAVVRWTESRYPGATLVTSTPIVDASRDELLTPETIALMRSTPGVKAVDEQYKNGPTVIFRGQTVRLAAISAEVVQKHGHISAVDRESAALAADLSQGAIAVSTGFSRTFRIEPGSSIELDTPEGQAAFVVAGVYEDFGDAMGTVLMDIGTYDAHWRRSGAWGAALWIEGEREVVLESIRTRVGLSQDLFFADASETAARNREGAEVFTGVLRVLGGFLSSLGGIAVAILLVGIVAEQRRHVSVLRAAGAEPWQLVSVVLLDGASIGLAGSLCGTALGLASATTAADVLRESYGWILPQRWYAPEIPFVLVGAVAIACIGAVVPARMAYRTPPSELFAPE